MGPTPVVLWVLFAAWPYILASVVLEFGHCLSLIRAYRSESAGRPHQRHTSESRLHQSMATADAK